MQENWIGKSQGMQFRFDLSNGEAIEVYTTRPDTIFGASFVAVAPDHPIAQQVAMINCDAGKFIERVGFYDPKAPEGREHLRVAMDRLSYWKEKGARLSPTVARLVKGIAASAASAPAK